MKDDLKMFQPKVRYYTQQRVEGLGWRNNGHGVNRTLNAARRNMRDQMRKFPDEVFRILRVEEEVVG